MTATEYLEAEAKLERPHEFWQGEMVARGGKSVEHLTISVNLLCLLGESIKNTRNHVGGSQLRVQIEPQIYVYPDIVVWSDKAQWGEHEQDTLLTPLLLAEITSPDSESRDRREKLDAYRELPSLRDYLIISPERVSVDHYWRTEPSQTWNNRHYTRLAETIRFAAFDLAIEAAEFYRRLSVPEGLRSIARRED